MAKKGRPPAKPPVIAVYRQAARRVNVPQAGIAARGRIPGAEAARYTFSPYLDPALRFDSSASADGARDLVEKATLRPLTRMEAKRLSDALATTEPWLEWSGKREVSGISIQPPPLSIHERVSQGEILRTLTRDDVTPTLFSEPQLPYSQAVKFYGTDVDWTNRLVLGDSLSVMVSLSRREALAGQVQMIYFDPPYGIKYRSNFQPQVGETRVEDRPEDLTRQVETVKAYRDTWKLGVHSYLSYLRERLTVARELLRQSGSIFVQIGEDHAHRVKAVLDETFGSSNHCATISFIKTSGLESELLASRCDYLLWYAKDRATLKYRPLFAEKDPRLGTADTYSWAIDANGDMRPMTRAEKDDLAKLPDGAVAYKPDNITSQGNPVTPFTFRQKTYRQAWKATSEDGRRRLVAANRLHVARNSLQYVRKLSDFKWMPLTSFWSDTGTGSFLADKTYSVQTNPKVIERCMLMTTDVGDLVLDPTCGSGTTPYVAEKWARRWIGIDVSRVAIAITRQLLITSRFDYYRLRPIDAADQRRNPEGSWIRDGDDPQPKTFECASATRIRMSSITRNDVIDVIIEKWRARIDELLRRANEELSAARRGGNTIPNSSAHGRRTWRRAPSADEDVFPAAGWTEESIPRYDTSSWPEALRGAVRTVVAALNDRGAEFDRAIEARAVGVELIDRPRALDGVVRATGTFTIESTIAPPLSTAYGGGTLSAVSGSVENADAHVDRVLDLLRTDGVTFLNNRRMRFRSIERISNPVLHAEGIWSAVEADSGNSTERVAICIGPEYGAVSAVIVEEGLRAAARRGFSHLVIAGYSIDAMAQAVVQDDPDPAVRLHIARISPDVELSDLLKTTHTSQLFTVSGLPRTTIVREESGDFRVLFEGVDIYDPVLNAVRSSGPDKVAAWFVDSDYDGRLFVVSQAFFPNRSIWDDIRRTLRLPIESDDFEKLNGTESLPFAAGAQKRVAIKVIDPRGDESISVHALE